MFVIALILGPAAGILAGDVLFRSWRLAPPAAAVIIAVCLVVIAALPLATEFKVGILLGLVLGLILSTARTGLEAEGVAGEFPQQTHGSRT